MTAVRSMCRAVWQTPHRESSDDRLSTRCEYWSGIAVRSGGSGAIAGGVVRFHYCDVEQRKHLV